MESTPLDWIDYAAVALALALLFYSSYRCATKMGKIHTNILHERQNQDVEAARESRRLQLQANGASGGPSLFTIATVVMTTNAADSVRSGNTEYVEDQPPPYDEAIFYPISKAMSSSQQEA